MSQEGQVVDTTSFANSFPFVDGKEIHRDHILQTLETMLDSRGVQSVHVEGPPGSGKTTLLGQFAKRNHRRCISVFAKRTSSYSLNLDFLLRSLADQMSWLLNRAELPHDIDVDDATIRKLVYQLRSYSARIQKPVVLIVDGLDEIPDAQRDLKKELISKLPLGLDYIKLLSSSNAVLFGVVERAKEWLLPMFSFEESLNYFDGQLSPECVRIIHTTCNGSPGYLSSMRRLVESGNSETELLAELPTNLAALFALEWRSVDESDSLLVNALSVLAHDSFSHSVDELSGLLGCHPEDLRARLRPLRFVGLPEDNLGTVGFVTEPFRQFAAAQLVGHRETIYQLMIERLGNEEDSEKALTLLPSYLRETRQNARLLQYLSPERFGQLLTHSHQINPVKEKILLGLQTASEAESHSEMLRFAVQSSAVAQYSGYTVSRSEIVARMELEDLNSCIELAQAAVLVNDRLRLFAALARIRRERGESLEPEFIKELETLFERAEWKELTSEAINLLAADLVYVRPDLATSALERTNDSVGEGSGRLDMAIATASMLAERSQDQEIRANADRVRSRISSPRILALFNAVSAIMREIDAAEVLRRVREIEAPRDQLFLLKQWALHARAKEGVHSVVSYAMDLAIKTTEYTPTATDFRELGEAIRRLENREELRSLLDRFDAQKADIERVGPTSDFIYLQLLLALGEARLDKGAAGNRLVDVFAAISQLSDLATKAGCLARLLDLLPLIDPTGEIRAREGIETLSLEDFESAVQELLACTADHRFATKEIIAALAPRYPSSAIKLARSLNTAPRRDNALAWVVDKTLSLDDDQIDLSWLEGVCSSFYDTDDMEEAVTNVLERLSRVKDSDSIKKHKTVILFCIQQSVWFRNPVLQVKAACAARLCLHLLRGVVADSVALQSEERLRLAWERLDLDEEKISLAFDIAAAFAKVDRVAAMNWLKRAEGVRAATPLASSSDPFRHCVLLICRSYSGMVARRLDELEDLSAIERLIKRIPSAGERLAMWTDLGLRLLVVGRVNDARSVVQNFILKIMPEFPSNTTDRFRAICTACPLLFHTHKTNCLELIAELPATWKDSAVSLIADYICKKVPSWEPFEARHDHAYSLSLDEVRDLCELSEMCHADILTYWVISRICSCLRIKDVRREISGNQRADIISKLKAVASAKFPNPQYIQHLGYSILSFAEIANVEKFQRNEWEKIVQDAIAIPNTADRCLVLAYVAAKIGKTDRDWALSLLQQCERDADSIPSALDRVSRFELLARDSYGIDRDQSRRLYLKALMITSDQDQSEYERARKGIIDSAYLINPELASSLASALDSDQARRAQRGVTERMEVIKLRKKLAEASIDRTQMSGAVITRISQASWELLGSLNSGRVVPLRVAQTAEYIECASSLPFESAFAVYSFVVENAIRRSQDKADAFRVVRGGFNALLTAAELFYFLAENSIPNPPPVSAKTIGTADDFCVVEQGHRNVANSFIERWLAKLQEGPLNISDPFFGPHDAVDVLKMVLLINPALEVNIVTSKRGLQNAKVEQPFKDSFQQAWNEASSQSPPITRVIVVDVGGQGDPLIHDRWWVTADSALDMGTSFNALGTAKQTKISIMSEAEKNVVLQRVTEEVRMMQRSVDGKRVVYESFELS